MSNGNQNSDNAQPQHRSLLPLAIQPTQPRQPRNLQDLLRYAVEAGSAGGAEEINLNPERREFITNAVSSMTVDVKRELVESIEVLKTLDKYEENPASYEAALCKISEHIDNIDNANDFVKLGGFDVALLCLQSKHSEVRWMMADIIAQCAQNNPFSQMEALKKGFLSLMLTIAESDRDEKCRIKAFFAASNIVRSYQPAIEEFVKLNGFAVVLRAMESSNERLQNKATFFLSAILSENPKLIADLLNKGFIEELINMIKKEHSTLHEHIISALLTIVKNSRTAENECRRADLSLLPTLTKILNEHGHDEAFREEITDIKDLILLVFPEEPDVER